jgi:hypothetical protein
VARRRLEPESTHTVQAEVEGVGEIINADFLTFMDEKYRVADSIGLMPLLRFSHAASRGLDSDSYEGMAALYAMIRDVIHTDDWSRFEEDAILKKAEGDDLMKVVTEAIEVVSARPKRQPSSSSDGSPATLPSSKASSPRRGSRHQIEGLTSVDSLLDR